MSENPTSNTSRPCVVRKTDYAIKVALEAHQTDKEVHDGLTRMCLHAAQLMHLCAMHPDLQGDEEVRRIAEEIRDDAFNMLNQMSVESHDAVADIDGEDEEDGQQDGHGGVQSSGQNGLHRGGQDGGSYNGHIGVDDEDQDGAHDDGYHDGQEPYDEQGQDDGGAHDEGDEYEDDGGYGGNAGWEEHDEHGGGH